MDTHVDAQVSQTRMQLMQQLNRLERRDPDLSARVRLESIDLHRAWATNRLSTDEYALRLAGLCDRVREQADVPALRAATPEPC